MLLHYHEDFVTHPITIIKFVLHTFSEKYNCNRIFSALTHHTIKFITYIYSYAYNPPLYR